MFSTIKRIVNNEYVYSVLAKVFGIALGLVYTILFSRYMGADLRGAASIVTNFSTLASLGLCIGVYQAYPYFRKNSDKPKDELYMEYINNCIGMCIIYVLLCSLVIAFVPVSLGRKISFVLIPFMVGTKLLNYVVLIETPKIRNTASIYLFLIDIVIIIVLMIFTKANLFYCYSFLILKEVIYFFIAFKNLKVPITKIRPTVKNLPPYIRYGWIPMITVILMEVNYKVDVLMLEGKVSKADIGIYSLGVQLAERLWLVPDALKDILLSKLSKGKGVEEVAKVTRISLAAVVVCIILAIIFGRFFINLLFGEEFSDSYYIMLVILASVISMVFYKMVYSFNVANGHRVVNMVILGIAAIANVGINYFLIPVMGNMGAAVASLVSYSVCGLTFLLYFVIKTKTPIYKMLFMTISDFKQLAKIVVRKEAKDKKTDEREKTDE